MNDNEQAELGLVRILPIGVLIPSPENDKLYRPIDPSDPAIQDLAASIRDNGVKEPLVISRDNYVISGHRRLAAAKLARLREVPCRIESCSHGDAEFLPLLREFNRQREKTREELAREEIVSASPEEAHRLLVEHRRLRARVNLGNAMCIGERKRRPRISSAKMPFLKAIQAILLDLKEFLPVSQRQIHYRLLPPHPSPLIHASKPRSVYRNDKKSSSALSELITRARVEGLIPYEAIDDDTRPVCVWDAHASVRHFVKRELGDMFKGYYRDLMQSQPNHVEILGEKKTLSGVISPVAMEYCIPYTLGGGKCSIPPRRDIAKRFKASGKQKLILLLLSDFDPDGIVIAESFARSMRDDFHIGNVVAIRVALTEEQVSEYHLPPGMKANPNAATYDAFVKRYGDAAYELEALEPKTLQQILRGAIDSVIDIEAFNHEIDEEAKDAAFIDELRQRSHKAIAPEVGMENTL